nr:unnamed protein product [Digitaria exilis]
MHDDAWLCNHGWPVRTIDIMSPPTPKYLHCHSNSPTPPGRRRQPPLSRYDHMPHLRPNALSSVTATTFPPPPPPFSHLSLPLHSQWPTKLAAAIRPQLHRHPSFLPSALSPLLTPLWSVCPPPPPLPSPTSLYLSILHCQLSIPPPFDPASIVALLVSGRFTTESTITLSTAALDSIAHLRVYCHPPPLPHRLNRQHCEPPGYPFHQQAIGQTLLARGRFVDQSAPWSPCQHSSMETHLPRMYSLVLCCFSTALHRPARPPPLPTCFFRRRRRLLAEHTERGTDARIDSIADCCRPSQHMPARPATGRHDARSAWPGTHTHAAARAHSRLANRTRTRMHILVYSSSSSSGTPRSRPYHLTVPPRPHVRARWLAMVDEDEDDASGRVPSRPAKPAAKQTSCLSPRSTTPEATGNAMPWPGRQNDRERARERDAIDRGKPRPGEAKRQTEREEWNGRASWIGERYLGSRRNWPGLRFWPLPPPRQLPSTRLSFPPGPRLASSRRRFCRNPRRWDDDEANDPGRRGKEEAKGQSEAPDRIGSSIFVACALRSVHWLCSFYEHILGMTIRMLGVVATHAGHWIDEGAEEMTIVGLAIDYARFGAVSVSLLPRAIGYPP